jgi:hypothetical protein
MMGNAGQDEAGKASHPCTLSCVPDRINLGVVARVTVISSI